MKKSLFDKRRSGINTTVLFAVTLALGVLTLFFGPFTFPLAVATLAAYTVLASEKKPAPIPCAVLATVPIVLGLVFGGFCAFFGILTVLSGFLIAVLYSFNRSKPEAVAITVISFLVFTLIFLWVSAATTIGTADFGAVCDYYRSAFSSVKAEALALITDTVNAIPDEMSYGVDKAELIAAYPAVLDSLAIITPAIVAIIAFALLGIAFKIFARLVFIYSPDGVRAAYWKLTTSNTVALFFVILVGLRLIVAENTALGITVANLYTFFNLLYAYIGFNFVTMLLSQKMKYFLGVLIVLGILSVLTSIAISVLAMLGVFFTYATNKVGGFGAPPAASKDEKRSEDESENDDEKD